MDMINCTECDAILILPDDIIIGEIVTCPDCGQVFESASHGLIKAEQIGEDWGQ